MINLNCLKTVKNETFNGSIQCMYSCLKERLLPHILYVICIYTATNLNFKMSKVILWLLLPTSFPPGIIGTCFWLCKSGLPSSTCRADIFAFHLNLPLIFILRLHIQCFCLQQKRKSEITLRSYNPHMKLSSFLIGYFHRTATKNIVLLHIAT